MSCSGEISIARRRQLGSTRHRSQSLDAHQFVTALPEGYDTRVGHATGLCRAGTPTHRHCPPHDPQRAHPAS